MRISLLGMPRAVLAWHAVILCFALSFAQPVLEENSPMDEQVMDMPVPLEAESEVRPQEEPVPPDVSSGVSTPAVSAAIVSPVVTGKNTISLDIKGMDALDVIKMLANRAGLNVVVGKNVTGKVTLFLKDVAIDDVFDIVILANDLAYEKHAGIINVMTQRDYELIYGERFQDKKQAKLISLQYARAADLSKALTQIKTNLGKIVVDESSNVLALIDTPERIKAMEDFIKNADLPLETKIFPLNYAQVDKVQAKIQEALTKGTGRVKIDERTNKVIVTDYPVKVREIESMLEAFDEKTMQVLIDAQIIEIKPSDSFSMGVDWDFWIEKNFKMTSALPLGTTERLLIGTVDTNPTGKGEYKAIVDLLRTIGDTKILSSPRILVLNNQEAKIHVGTKEAYITSTTSQGSSGQTVVSQSVNFVDTGIKLFVTPTISRDGFVVMKIRPEISSAVPKQIQSEGQFSEIPIVTTSEAETSVMLKNGVTLIIGGLKKEERTKTVKKIPLLADLPLLGHAFRSTSDALTKTELVILLTPHLMSGDRTYSDFKEIQPVDGAVARLEKGNILIERVSESAKPAQPPKEKAGQYNDLIINRIQLAAERNSGVYEKGQITLGFTLLRDGVMKNNPKVVKTDNPALKESAFKAIKESSPFPEFPDYLTEKELYFEVKLAYE